MPEDASQENVAPDPEPFRQTTDQLGRLYADRDQLGHELCPLGDDDPLLIQLIEDWQALFFELRRGYLFHSHKIALATSHGQYWA
jgi:hypothetical protein